MAGKKKGIAIVIAVGKPKGPMPKGKPMKGKKASLPKGLGRC